MFDFNLVSSTNWLPIEYIKFPLNFQPCIIELDRAIYSDAQKIYRQMHVKYERQKRKEKKSNKPIEDNYHPLEVCNVHNKITIKIGKRSKLNV